MRRVGNGDAGNRHRAADPGAAFPDAEVTIRDLAGDGDHYSATVLRNRFAASRGCSSTRSSTTHSRAEMGGKLHALALQTGVPAAELAEVTPALECVSRAQRRGRGSRILVFTAEARR